MCLSVLGITLRSLENHLGGSISSFCSKAGEKKMKNTKLKTPESLAFQTFLLGFLCPADNFSPLFFFFVD